MLFCILEKNDYENLCRMKITGTSFLNCKKEDLMSYDSLKWGTAIEFDSLKQKVYSVIKNAIKDDAN
ncbi:unnamed protein product [Rhizophagus irregularis]|uniref:Uncharacterized protein n=1 Tax=Rhizophagus irregularis TaxID=588596 RepID=A0A915YQ11_9GLOM|nr:unnamed protein product [Rhizophagus irregularis]